MYRVPRQFLHLQIITHDGGIPGFVSTIKVLPDDNIAVVSLLNTELPLQDIVPLAIIHSLLAPNEPFDPLTAHRGPPGPPPPAPVVPANPSENCTSAATVPLEHFAGTYVNPGYGNLTFCAPGDTSSAYCAGALSDWASISPNGTVAPNALYASTPRIATHAAMQYVCPEGPSHGSDSAEGKGKEQSFKFLLTLQSIYSHGFGRDTTPFFEGAAQLFPVTDVECVADAQGKVQGCGWLDIEPVGQPRTGPLRERAEVWWDKV